MKKYKCHKEVQAAKILDVIFSFTDSEEDDTEITLLSEDFEEYGVPKEWYKKHKPEIGGYFVRYKDGYESYSPAEAFESGYSLID